MLAPQHTHTDTDTGIVCNELKEQRKPESTRQDTNHYDFKLFLLHKVVLPIKIFFFFNVFYRKSFANPEKIMFRNYYNYTKMYVKETIEQLK